MKNEEHIEQVNFINWFHYNYPKVGIFAIPNGGKRSIKTAVQLKAEGVKKGVPDLFIPEFKIFIEMKKKKGGTTTKEQKDWLLYLGEVGYECHVCAGSDAAKDVIKQYHAQLK